MPFDTHFQTRTVEIAPDEPITPDEGTPEASEILCLLVSSRGALYGIEAARVREIHALPAISPLPRAPRFVAGIINVRGEIVLVIDLATRLGQTPCAPQLSDGLVVLQREPSPHEPSQRELSPHELSQHELSQRELSQRDLSSRQLQQIALRVDEVRGIVLLPLSRIEATPFAIEYSIVSGTTHWNGEIVLLLNASHLLKNGAAFNEPHETDDAEMSQSAASATQAENATQAASATQAVFRARAEQLAFAPQASRDAAMQRSPISLGEDAGSATAMARVVLGGEERGVVLTQVREFCALDDFAPVPCCPPHILGQMNLRGEIVTLLDIAPQLGLTSQWNKEPSRHLPNARVVIVNVAQRRDEVGLVGIVVEEVCDVLLLRPDEMRAVPAASRACDKLHGAVLHNDKWIPVLDLPALLSDADLIVDEMV